MSHALCYVERTGLGAVLTGVQVVTRRATKQWSVGAAPKSGSASAEATASAARWIIEQTTGASGGVKRTTMCVDLDASVCSWMTVPSPDARIVRAAAQAVQVGAGTDEGGGHSGTWLSHGSVGLDLSVQALAERPQTNANGKLPAILRQRIGVLAAPDLAVRALLDELDRLVFTPERVISLWHAMAEGWAAPASQARTSDDARVVASDEPTTAVVLVEASGRLHWCWSRSGTLLAAGSMRLRRSESSPEAEADRSDNRVATPARPVALLEVTRSDVGRVVGEWLAWSIELGLAPARIVCLGPDTITCAGLDLDLPGTSGVAAVGQALGQAWPGTVVVAEVLDDPIGTTLARLAERLDDDDGPSASAPSAEIEDLSSRPGRAARRMYQWLAAAIAMGAVLVGVLGYRLSADATATRGRIDQLVVDRAQLLTSLRPLAPAAASSPDPAAELRKRRGQVEAEIKAIKFEPPIVPEMLRILKGASKVPKVELVNLQMIGSLGQVEFLVFDPESAGRVLEEINALPSGPQRMSLSPSTEFKNNKGTLKLTGRWEEKDKPAATGATPAKPAAGSSPPKPAASPSAPKPAPAPAPDPTPKPAPAHPSGGPS